MKVNRYIMSREQMQSVWQNSNWQRVIDIFGLETAQKRRGKPDEIWIKSPFTDEDNASLHLNLRENIFKDFSSGKGAQKGILNFCQELLSQQGLELNCYEVAQWMVDNGISSVRFQNSDKNIKLRDEKEKKELSVNRPIKVDLRPWLRSDHPELKRRAISESTCRYLGCGYLPTSENGTKQSPLNGRIVFQVRGISEGQNGLKPIILTHVGRALTQKKEEMDGKYWSFPFRKGMEIYNQDKLLLDSQARHQIKQFGLILVEGFFDVASLVESGCFNVGALMGAQISKMQIARLKFTDTHAEISRVKLFLDRDEAGAAGSQKAVCLLKNNGFQVDVFNRDQVFHRSKDFPVKIPENIKDVGDMSTIQINWLRQKRII